MGSRGRIIRITREREEWHEPFFAHAAAAFSVDFRRWARHHGWGPGYEVAAIVEGGRVLSSIGCTRMALSVADPGLGRDFRRLAEAVQLGSVATVPDRQGRGLGRLLMDHVLAEATRKARPVILFSGSGAETYYPRFGFRPVASVRYRLPLTILPQPGLEQRVLDPASVRDRHLLQAMLAGNASHGGGLSARPDASILTWYLFNTPCRAVLVPALRALVFLEEEEGRLHIREWLGARPADIRPVLCGLATKAAGTVEFGFVPPPAWLPADFVPAPDPEAALFVRGLDIAPGIPVCFPDLLRT
ncbi:GNAT family N-acetyltransferase [Gellertiella hungarica]|uniref:GNAT superfamily N-acetyltransferase n=1 Tax=Gellertiella hungarica TaxID=1572859 RepID=A0A7W6J2V7_9HYPH|nr:GNAT family N-acetyltransferase [Gellertiella hungarica]MBB4063748.1 GNAT superfamily N-acetyltransferase [Gellertiella hungarica]